MASSIVRSLAIIGDWWTLLIVRDAFMGVTRFDEFHRHLGIARNILSSRMKNLVAAGIMERKQYLDKPARYEYVLTEKGVDLHKVLSALKQWGDKWIYQSTNLPFVVQHIDCGGSLEVQLRCIECAGEIKSPDERVWRANMDTDDHQARFWHSHSESANRE